MDMIKSLLGIESCEQQRRGRAVEWAKVCARRIEQHCGEAMAERVRRVDYVLRKRGPCTEREPLLQRHEERLGSECVLPIDVLFRVFHCLSLAGAVAGGCALGSRAVGD